jgi:hypothetical protein
MCGVEGARLFTMYGVGRCLATTQLPHPGIRGSTRFQLDSRTAPLQTGLLMWNLIFEDAQRSSVMVIGNCIFSLGI